MKKTSVKTAAKKTAKTAAKKVSGAKAKIKRTLKTTAKGSLLTKGKKAAKATLGAKGKGLMKQVGEEHMDFSHIVSEMVDAGAKKLAEVANTKIQKVVKDLEGRVAKKLG